MEELGIDLGRRAEFIGYAPSTKTHTGNMEVVPAVFVLKDSVEIRPNEEVASYRWVELDEFLAPRAQSTYRLDYDGREVDLPAFRVDDYLVWGLTHRILMSVLSEPEGDSPVRERR
jgi:8-oxo-dGTP pyrophosphatase MutT (NUDIX family)